ncbi:hypothetical protein PLICRDRAFT_52794 [Plicaturopsis crispa FD-325 SS-3]|nr:hypothetical protein PLICRDRAFT_52794 [Plicaturopsis crispa FD-325 SS-3]
MVSGASRHNTREASVASAGKHKRRLTLDEELRDADLDSGVLTGVGTRSKHKGFLAHGGAGGAPVFMGVGYVEGAEEDDEYDDVGDEDDYHPPRHATVKAKGKR